MLAKSTVQCTCRPIVNALYVGPYCIACSLYPTCRHLAGVLKVQTARSVFEAAVRVSNALDILVRLCDARPVSPPAVGRRITVQPVRGAESFRRLFV